MTTGAASSSSQPSSWDGSDRHRGAHFSLLVFPDNRMILTTPDTLEQREFDQVQAIMREWLEADRPYPLVIGGCIVHIRTTLSPALAVERART